MCGGGDETARGFARASVGSVPKTFRSAHGDVKEPQAGADRKLEPRAPTVT